MLMPFLIDSSILRVSIIPLFGPVLLDLVVIGVDLSPILSLFVSRVEIDLPLVAPLFFLVVPVDFTPLLVPFLMGVIVSAVFFAVAFFNLGTVRFVFV
jgi:hypothetical protein